MKTLSTLPMRTAGTQHLIERTYRESGPFQWGREGLMNSLEAGATRVDFGIEWQAVTSKGVYRRTIADNGKGMTAEQLVEFFNTFGGGGKPIGGIHENFGVGSKTSLMPWNTYGMVVISWVNGEPSMVWVRKDSSTGEYGLRQFRALTGEGDEEVLESVVEPFDDHVSGCDWSKVKPDFIDQHGTIIILMGNGPKDDTIQGDPGRGESDLKGLASYLNRRVWKVPEGVEITVLEMRKHDKKAWPKSPDPGDVRTHRRIIKGGHHYVTYPSETFNKGKISDSGTLLLRDQTKLHWYLWEGDRPGVHSYAANQGYIAALYKNELYDQTNHLATYRSFGVTDAGVRQRLWIIAEPVPYDEKTRRGVYPRTDRNTLLLQGGPEAGTPMPYPDWGAEFADNMPDPIRAALKAAYDTASASDANPEWRLRIAERFGDRWRVPKLRASIRGGLTVDASQTGGEPVVRPKRIGSRSDSGGTRGTSEPRHASTGTGGALLVGIAPGSDPAEKVRLGVGIPSFKITSAEELEPGMLAAWAPHYPGHPEGVVLLNGTHPVLKQQVDYWRAQYADHLGESVEKVVLEVYGQVAVAKVAHSEKLKGILPSDVVEKELRSEQALTMGLLGLMAEEALISQKLGAIFGKRKVPIAPAEVVPIVA